MRTDGHTIKGQELEIPHLDLGAFKGWLKRTFSRDNLTKACLVMAGTLSVCYWAARTYQAFQAF